MKLKDNAPQNICFLRPQRAKQKPKTQQLLVFSFSLEAQEYATSGINSKV